MKTTKSKEAKAVKAFKAAEGKIFPIYYKGSIVKIGQEAVEIDVEHLSYESKIQFDQALKLKSIFEVGG